MIRRTLVTRLRRTVQAEGAVLIEGPAGAGKTTLVRAEFPQMLYVSMRDSKDRSSARQNPAAFAARLKGSAIVDDVHLAPELARYTVGLSQRRALILASSLKLSVPITTLRLYRPTFAERDSRQPVPIEMLGRFIPAQTGKTTRAAPLFVDRDSIERDVAGLLQFRDLDRFYRFFEIASQASGEILDVQKLARTAGTSRTTAVRWLAILDACFLTIRIEPSGFDFGRRIVQSPKLHFLDSPLFESSVVSELYRNAAHTGIPADLRYWRDSNGLEVALIYQSPGAPPMGIHIAESPNAIDYGKLQRWMKLSGTHSAAMISAHAPEVPRGPILRYAVDRL